MSLLGFLRFIPSSRFFASEGECIVNLSSASVMGRQVLEDTLAFLYLSEPNLTGEQKHFVSLSGDTMVSRNRSNQQSSRIQKIPIFQQRARPERKRVLY